MEQWIGEAARLLRRGIVKPAAALVMANFPSARTPSVDEQLVEFAVADALVAETVSRIARNKDVVSEDDQAQLTAATDLARQALPKNPLLLNIMVSASYYWPGLAEEIVILEQRFGAVVA